MLASSDIEQAVQRIVAATHPRRVVVFGSYGRGEADEGSDLDILVTEDRVLDTVAESVRLHRAVGDVGVGVDVVVYPEAEFVRRSQVPGTLPYWAKMDGKVMYDAPA